MGRKKKRERSSLTKRLLYLASHLTCAVIVIVLFLTLVQCTIKKPEAPTWDTSLVIPLANKTWLMSELIEKLDQDNLLIDSSGNPIFLYETSLDTITIDASFTIPNVSQAMAESLGIINLGPIANTNFVLSLTDRFPSLPPGVFPDTSFGIVQTFPPLGDFSTATIASGSAILTMNNDFGLTLDTIIIIITDDVYNRQIASYSIPGGLTDGSSSVDTIDLSGQTISNQLSTQIHCHALEQLSFTLSGKSMATSFGIPDGLSVSSATAVIPEIIKSFSDVVEISSIHKLQTATLVSGDLLLNIVNSTNLSSTLTITMSDIKNGSDPLVISQPVNPTSSVQYVYSLTGYTLEPADQVMPQSLSIGVQALIDSSGPAMVTVNAGDNISVTASIRNIELGTVQGVIGATTATFDSIQQTIDVPTGFGEIQLPSTVLTIEVKNAVNIPGNFDVTITGNQGQSKIISGVISPGTQGSPVTTLIVDSNLASFMNPIPETITITGSATFGDGVTSGSIAPNDFLVTSITLSSPLEMIIDSTTFDGEWVSTTIDQKDITKITDNLKLATIFMTVVNHLPLTVNAEIVMGGDSATLYSNPEVTLGPIIVESGTLNPDGTVSAAVISQSVLQLDSIEIHVLENDTLWIGEVITLSTTTGGTAVRLSATDSLSINAYIESDFSISESLWEDN